MTYITKNPYRGDLDTSKPLQRYIPTDADQDEVDFRHRECKDFIREWGYSKTCIKRAEHDTFFGAVYYDCIKPKIFQMKLMDIFDELQRDLENGKREFKGLLVTTGRQVGKTTAISTIVKPYAWYHKNPTNEGKTIVGIFSNNEENSKKLIENNIKDRIYNSDNIIEGRTGGKEKKYLLSMIYQKNGGKKGEIITRSFKGTKYNGDKIFSLPPTSRGRGHTFSLCVIDEIAHLEDETFIPLVAVPTVRKTRGMVLGFTTPNGSSGLFYAMFDPENTHDTHAYRRFWIGEGAFETDEEKEDFARDKQEAINTGMYAKFQQEMEASFTVSQSKFFDPVAIDKHTLERRAPLPMAINCIMGIDIGVTQSKTVVSIISPTGGNNSMGRKQYELVYQYEYSEDDTNLLEDVTNLCSTYDVKKIFIDQCPQGHYFEIKAIQQGLPIIPIKFSSQSKQKMFGDLYRAFSDSPDGDCLWIYNEPELQKQLKAMLLKPTQTVDKIEKPKSGRDDRCDSLALACYDIYNDIIHDEEVWVTTI